MTGLPVLGLERVSVRFGRAIALKSVSLEVGAGEVVALVGESGSGKSTLLRAVLGLVPVAAGRIEIAGTESTRARGALRRRLWREVQPVFQNAGGSLSPRLSLLETLVEPMRAHGMTPAAAAGRARELLSLVGLGHVDPGARPGSLSGGQRQRVAIARALALSPRLILADEPMSALDVSVKAQVAELLLAIRDRTGTAFLIVSHDLALMAHMADRIAVLDEGQIVESGPAMALARAPVHPKTRELCAARLDPFDALEASA